MSKETNEKANATCTTLTVRQYLKIEAIKSLLANPDYTNANPVDHIVVASEIADAFLSEDVAYEKLCNKLNTTK